MKRPRAWLVALAFVLVMGSGITAWSIGSCADLCSPTSCALVCADHGGCRLPNPVCLSDGTGQCQILCEDLTAVFSGPCDNNCPTDPVDPGGGSPVFKKPHVQRPPSP